MAEETIGLKVKVDTGGADASMGSLKKQLREAQADVQALADKFGITSKEAINAAKRAGELKDKIGDARALVDAFNPDAKFKALTASLSGVAGGFAAVQGGMALLGNESQDVQKALLKVQSAMALSQGLQAVGESIDSFKQLGAVIKNQVSGAFSSLKGAIAATGIGLLVVGVGLLIANFEKVKETLLKLFPDLSKFADSVMSIVNAITDFVGVTSEAERANEKLNTSLTKSNEVLDRQIKVLEAQGGKEEEIYKKKRERIENQIKLLNDSNDKEKKGRQDLATELEILRIQEDNRIKTKNAAALKEQQRLADEAAAIKLDNENKALQAEMDAANARNARFRKIGAEMVGVDGLTNTEREKKKNDEKKQKEKDAANQLEIDAQLQAITENMATNGIGKMLTIKAKGLVQDFKQEEENSVAKQAVWKIEETAKQAQIQNMMGFIGNLGAAFEQGTAASKTAAIAEIGINTALGYIQGLDIAQKGAKGTGPLAPFTMPIFYASQILAVVGAVGKAKNALSQVKGGGGSGGSISAPSLASVAPMSPSLAQAAPTTLSQGTINDIGNQAIKTYVVESDMTSNQQRIAAIQQRARFS